MTRIRIISPFKKPENCDPTSLSALQTLQIGGVHPIVALAMGANVDALFQGEGGSLPSTVIMDCVYGVAAYKSWRRNRGNDLMDDLPQNPIPKYSANSPCPTR